MNVKVENLPNSQALVTIEVEPERVADAREKVYQRLSKEVVIPGFRKGRAPRRLVERYVSRELVDDEAESYLMDEIWDELRTGQLKDSPLYDTPQIRVAQHDPLVFEMVLTLQPSVQLGDYKSIRIAPELVTVTDDDVMSAIERLREQQAQWQPVEHRPVRQGDMVTVHVHGNLGSQPLAVAEEQTITVVPGSRFIVPDFAMRLIDMEIGKEKEFAIEMPPDATSDPAMANATGTAYVTVTEIKEKVLPPLDDATAKMLGYDDVATMKETIRTTLLKVRQDEARDRLVDRILDAIAAISTISFPAVMVDQQVESMIANREQALKQQGIDMNLYLRLTGMTMNQLRADLRPIAEKRIRNYLLAEEFARAEGIMVEDSAVTAEIERITAAQQDPQAARRNLSTNEMYDAVKNNLRIERILDRMIAIVTEDQEPVAPAPPAEPVVLAETSAAAESAEDKTDDESKKPKLIIATH
jgi:trigger factor